MQRLEPALNLFVEKKYLESWLLSGESLVLNKHPDFVERVQLALPFLSSAEKASASQARAEGSALAKMLEDRGVATTVAMRICANEDAEHRSRVRAAVEYFDSECAHGKTFANPGGFLVSLIAKGAPKSRETPRQVGAKIAGDPTVEVEIAYETYRNDVGKQQLEALSSAERAALVAHKRRELLTSSNRRTFEKMPPKAFEDHVHYMVRKELANQYAESYEAWRDHWAESARRVV
jgi:hypothetical protein